MLAVINFVREALGLMVLGHGGYRDGGWSDEGSEGLSFRGWNEHMALTKGGVVGIEPKRLISY